MDDVEPIPFFQSLFFDIQEKSNSFLAYELSPNLPPTIGIDHQRLQQIVYSVSAYLMRDISWGSILLSVDYLDDSGRLVLTFSTTKVRNPLKKDFFYPASSQIQKDMSSWMLVYSWSNRRRTGRRIIGE